MLVLDLLSAHIRRDAVHEGARGARLLAAIRFGRGLRDRRLRNVRIGRDALLAAGAKAVGLGPRILRCETAPLAALAAVMTLAGELE